MKVVRIFANTFIRSFYLQASWNFERMQNLGFLYVMLPYFRSIYPDKEKRKEVLLRHLGYFNTHPYMASVIFGIVASMEEELVEKNSITPEAIVLIKTNMAGPLAAIGDAFFWATWRPFSAALALFLVVFFYEDPGFRGGWFAPLFFLVIYNSLHIPFRYWGLKTSFRVRTKVVKLIAGLEFQRIISLVRYSGMIVLASSFVIYILFYFDTMSQRITVGIVFALGIFGGSFIPSASLLFYIFIVLCTVLSLVNGKILSI